MLNIYRWRKSIRAAQRWRKSVREARIAVGWQMEELTDDFLDERIDDIIAMDSAVYWAQAEAHDDE